MAHPTTRATRVALLVAGVGLVMATGCRTGAKAGQAERSEAAPTPDLEEAEAQFEHYKTHHVIPADAFIDAPSTVRRKLERKGDALMDVYEAYRPLYRSERAGESAAAALRIGQLYLNMGCELARIQPPGSVADARRRRKFAMKAQKRSRPVLEKAKGFFQVAEQRDVGDWSERAGRWLEAWKEAGGETDEQADVMPVCRATREAWAWEDAAAADKFRRACENGEVRACVRVGRFLGADEGDPYLERACEAGASDGCVQLAEYRLAAGRASQARRYYGTACELRLERACVARKLVVDPQRADRAWKACKDGQPRACLKRATLLADAGGGGDSETRDGGSAPRGRLLERCQVEDLPEEMAEKAAREKCGDGSPEACLFRAAGLLASDGTGLLPDDFELMGQFGGDGASNDEAVWGDQTLEVVKSECESGDGRACLEWGNRRAEDDSSPERQYRDACGADIGGACHKLGELLLENGEAAEGIEALRRGCRLGATRACEAAGRAFVEGRQVPAHAACGIAFYWQSCRADNLSGCAPLEGFEGAESED